MATDDLFDEYLEQIKSLQQKFIKTAIENSSGATAQEKFSASFENIQNLQKDCLSATLKVQESGVNAVLNAQKEMWNNYFKFLQNSPLVK